MDNFLKKVSMYKSFAIDDVSFLYSPAEFYNSLLQKLDNCTEAYLCALYIGTDPKCDRILEIIQKRKINKLKTLVMVDKNRAGRTHSLSTRLKNLDIEDIFVFIGNNSFSILPLKMKEIIGVLHSKVYIFDDVIMITGANLEMTYFTNRIDRYIVIRNRNLANYLYNEHFLVHDTQRNQKVVNETQPSNSRTGTFIMPFDRDNEIEVLKYIFSYEYKESYLSTAYINLTKEHLKILKGKKINLIIGSNSTNAYDQKVTGGGMIPEYYILNTKDALKRLPDLQLNEYMKPNSTFHGKGLWCFHDDFIITIIGSTNFNHRSIHRDVESNFLVISDKSSIRNDLDAELKKILECSVPVDKKEFMTRQISCMSKISHFFTRGYL